MYRRVIFDKFDCHLDVEVQYVVDQMFVNLSVTYLVANPFRALQLLKSLKQMVMVTNMYTRKYSHSVERVDRFCCCQFVLCSHDPVHVSVCMFDSHCVVLTCMLCVHLGVLSSKIMPAAACCDSSQLTAPMSQTTDCCNETLHHYRPSMYPYNVHVPCQNMIFFCKLLHFTTDL